MTQFSRLQKEQIRSVAEPIWKNIIEAARERDYARFSRGFATELLAKLSEEHFRQSCEDFPVAPDQFGLRRRVSRPADLAKRRCRHGNHGGFR
jgi:hypothetical protein